MEKLDKHLRPNMQLAAVCGLFCPSCTVFIGTQEAPARLSAMASRMGRTVEELSCDGCRSDKLCYYCSNFCKMKDCASAKGVTFCSECDEYPCANLREFQAAMPHRAELWESLAMLKEQGMDAWFQAMAERYTCPKCGILNSAYDLKCRACGDAPGSAFAAAHMDEISLHLKKTTGAK